jgi:hypothetical protein
MNLSANYNVGLRKLFGPSTPKQQRFGDPFSVRSRQLVQVGFETPRCAGPQKSSRIPNPSTLRIGSSTDFYQLSFAHVNLIRLAIFFSFFLLCWAFYFWRLSYDCDIKWFKRFYA